MPSFKGWYRIIPVAFSIIVWWASGQTLFDYARHVTHKAESFLDDVKLVIKTFRYGINTVEGVLKDSKDADCVFTCPDGSTPRPKIGYKPNPNGCGTYGLQLDPKELPHKDMNNCCNKHDVCYGTCLVRKEDCDSMFLSCLESVCVKKASRGAKDKDKLLSCKATSKAFYTGSQFLGCKAFKDAQRQSCYCGKRNEL